MQRQAEIAEIKRIAPVAPDRLAEQRDGVVAAPDAPSIYTAIQEQLGLKLESTKGPVEVLVIDSIEQPTSD